MKTKTIKGIKVDYKSTNPEDFIDILNEVSPQIEGVSNLGVFADITKVTPLVYLSNEADEHFINVTVHSGERPNLELINDSSSPNPYDHLFAELLNGASEISTESENKSNLKKNNKKDEKQEDIIEGEEEKDEDTDEEDEYDEEDKYDEEDEEEYGEDDEDENKDKR